MSMTNDILCPSCSHSLAFHKFDYGSCEAPLGGLTSKNLCGCPVTVHTYIQNLQAKDSSKEQLEKLEIKYQTCMDEMVNAHAVLILTSKHIEFLKSKLKGIRELVEKIKLVEKDHFGSGWFGVGYRNDVIKIVNEIILELEKDMINEQHDSN